MSTVSEVIASLERIAPPELAEDWDNVGLLIGRNSANVQKVMTCLTLTPDVAAEAISSDVNLIVTHHPLMFRSINRITDATGEGRLLMSLIEHQVAVYSPHTSFDSAAMGVNHQLAKAFGLSRVSPLRPDLKEPDVGAGRYGQVGSNTTLGDFLSVVRAAVNTRYVEFAGELHSPVSSVAVACGAGSGFLADARALGCDTFVTGECRFHSVLEAGSFGMNMILLGHFASERPAVESLARVLSGEFCSLEVFPSRAESDPLSVEGPG